jgi:ribosomal protein S6
MKKYELVVIVDAMLSQDEKEAIIKEVTEAITKVDGKLSNRQVWLEKNHMAFRMKRSTEGTYYVLNFESAPASVMKLRQTLQLNEKILRFLLIQGE